MRRHALMLMALLGLGPTVALAQADAAAAAETDSQREARALVMGMASFLAAQDAFSVETVAGFDVVQDDGQKIQFVEARDILLDRPDRLLIREESADGRGQTLLFDGAAMTVYDGEANVFAQVEQPETVDDAILYFVRELQMRLPLAPMLTTWVPDELSRRMLEVDYVEFTGVFGQPAHHVAARLATTDFQVWIADGEVPVPLRVVLTYPDTGQPQYWAQFSNWNLNPEIQADSFAFELPEDAGRIVFAVQIPPEAEQPDPVAGEQQ